MDLLYKAFEIGHKSLKTVGKTGRIIRTSAKPTFQENGKDGTSGLGGAFPYMAMREI